MANSIRKRVPQSRKSSAELLRELDQHKKVSDLYGALPRVAAPEDFEARLAARMAPKVLPFWQRDAVRTWAPILAAASVVLVSGTFWWIGKDARETGVRMTTAALDEAAQSGMAERRDLDGTTAIVPEASEQTFFSDHVETGVAEVQPSAYEAAAGSAPAGDSNMPEFEVMAESAPPPPPPATDTPAPAMAKRMVAEAPAAKPSPAPKPAAPVESIALTVRPEAPAPMPEPKNETWLGRSLADGAAAVQMERTSEDVSLEADALQVERDAVRAAFKPDGEFTLTDGTWMEAGYEGQSTVPWEARARQKGSDAELPTILIEHPVVFELNGKWYRYTPPSDTR